MGTKGMKKLKWYKLVQLNLKLVSNLGEFFNNTLPFFSIKPLKILYKVETTMGLLKLDFALNTPVTDAKRKLHTKLIQRWRQTI